MRAAVVVFPGTWSDGDCIWAESRLSGLGIEAPGSRRSANDDGIIGTLRLHPTFKGRHCF